MYHLNVEDMTCGHCVATIEKAVKTVDRKRQGRRRPGGENRLHRIRSRIRGFHGRDRRGWVQSLLQEILLQPCRLTPRF